MLDNHKVSVIIPVYNSGEFLEESLESVLNQTYSDIEIIAINDGSTDNSLEILKQYEDKIIIINQENLGLARAVNSGINKMNGKWLKWLSPDDIMYPETIALLVDATKTQSENTIVYSNWNLIDEKSHLIRQFSESNFNDLSSFEYNVRLLDGQKINVNTTLIPSVLFKNGCLFQNLENHVLVDYDFFLRAAILFNTKFYLIPKPLIQYRIHSKQLSRKNISKSLNYLSNVKKDIISELDETTRSKYLKSLEKFNKSKSLFNKTLDFGLALSLKLFPDWVTDRLVTFYLNKIRQTR
jgi:glycosyltransferase involved in cell wall biosynthesis